MHVPNSTIRPFKWATLALLAAVIFGLFQNCGKATHVYPIDQPSAVAPTATPNILVLMDGPQQNITFRVALQGNQIYAGTEYYWTSSYADGTSCTAAACGDGSVVTLTCAKLGPLNVHLVSTDTNGQMNGYDLNLEIVADQGSQLAASCSTPSPTPTPTPTPTPGPPPTSGQTLYANNCAGCHGPLASSSKHGITRNQLDTAIATVSAMAGLSGLSSTDRDAIVQALQ